MSATSTSCVGAAGRGDTTQGGATTALDEETRPGPGVWHSLGPGLGGAATTHPGPGVNETNREIVNIQTMPKCKQRWRRDERKT